MRTCLHTVVVQLGLAVAGAPRHCDVVPAAVGGRDAAQVVGQPALILHHSHACEQRQATGGAC